MSDVKAANKNLRIPKWGWVGLLLVTVFWYVNWNFEGLRTHFGFFPLWLGYCLVVDAITFSRKGDSLISRSLLGFALLFAISAPAWWLFEVLNAQAQYWHYTHREAFSDLEYFFYATLSFSTVIPAVFSTSELIGTFSFVKKPIRGPRIGKSLAHIWIMFIIGSVMFIMLFIYPEYSAAFMWMSLYLMLDPINHYLGNRTIIHRTAKGDWREVIALWTGCLICGFFWEMWNYYSNPKWYYTIPYVDFWYVFEMPLVGYLGYLPFALELFALYHLVIAIPGKNRWQQYLRVLAKRKEVGAN